MKRLAIPALLLILVLAVLPANAETAYFAVVNQTISPFEILHQPRLSDRGIMMPHIVLTGESAGPNSLGIRSQWSPEEGYFTLYNNSLQLTFVLGQSTAFSGSERYTAPHYRVIDGESTVFFVPIELVCDVFGFTLTATDTKWGTMVRVTNVSTLSDDQFIRFRDWRIQEYYDAYTDALPSPSPPASPGPSAPVVSAPLPPLPAASPSPSAPELYPVSVYLTFDGAANGATRRLLDFLEREGLPALFFLPSESLADDPASVRRIAARHQIGLLLDEPDGEALDGAVRRGNALLREAAFVKTWLLRSDNAPADTAGYRYWGYSLRFAEEDGEEDILALLAPLLEKRAEPAELVLSFPHSDAAADALAGLLPLMGKDYIRGVNPGEPPVAP